MFYYIEISQHTLSQNGLIAIGDTRHAAHDAQHVVVNRVDADLGSVGSRNRGGRENKLEHSVVNAREVARPGRLVLFGPQGEGIDVDASVRGTRVVLERLDDIKVRSLTLGEAILSVELELGRDDGVLSPAVHVKSRLGEDEGAGIGEARGNSKSASLKSTGRATRPRARGRRGKVNTSSLLEQTSGVNEGARRGTNTVLGAEGVDRVREGINGVSVVEGLGAEGLVEGVSGNQRRAVVNVGIRLHDPDKLLARVVEVELDLVGGGSNGLVSSELELLEQVLVGVLRHLPALISVKEDVVNVEGGGNKGLLVGSGNRDSSAVGGNAVDRPEALADGAEIKVDLDLVVLKGNQGEGKSRVPAEPELEGHVEGGLREGVAGSANLGGRARGSAGARNTGEGGVRDVGELGGVSNHLEVPTLLLGGERNLVPDVHPVSVLAINALSADLNLNLGDELLADEVHPAGIDALGARRVLHGLVDLGEGDLEVGAVGKISVAGDRARHAASEVSLSGEGLLDGLHREVGVAPVRDLPEGDLRGACQEDVLRAVSYKLHKCSAHVFIIVYVKIIIWETNYLIGNFLKFSHPASYFCL
jgi:hypothetical protein